MNAWPAKTFPPFSISSLVDVGSLLVLVTGVSLMDAGNDHETDPRSQEAGNTGELLPQGQLVFVNPERHPDRQDEQEWHTKEDQQFGSSHDF